MSILSFSQNYRAIYELTFKPNKAKDSLVKDIYALDIFPQLKKSNFYNFNYYKNDSIMTAILKNADLKGGVNIDSNMLPKAKYPLFYTSENEKGYSLKTVDGDSYIFPDLQKANWKISNKTKKIKNWNSQKAETDFLGKHWIAWFSSDVPFLEGPYKFKNLPGLITEIQDSGNNYHFTLEGFYKISDKEFVPAIFKKAIPVTKSQFEKALSNYQKDPAGKLRQGIMVDESGNVFHMTNGFSKDFIDQVTKDRLKKMKGFNNPLEL
jgi:GLPGLI family protein